MKNTWRLILSPPARGTWNMAVDDAILEFCGKGRNQSTLRLYAWEPTCLSLGFAQPIKDVDLRLLTSHGWDLVRRQTGGRAVLHVDELTYSVIGSVSEPVLSGTVLESYNRLALALTQALKLLGLQVEINEKKVKQEKGKINPICFEVPSAYEITVDGKKLIGSAQTRRKNGILQHGSLPLTGDITRIIQVLDYPNENARREAGKALQNRATTVEGVLYHHVTWQETSQAFIQAFQSELELDLQSGELTQEEMVLAKNLESLKYGNSEWTENRIS
jgi:lipoate-protein ligase A